MTVTNGELKEWSNIGSQGSACLIGAILALLLPLYGLAQSHSAFPVDILAGPAPRPVMADGRIHLLYELHLSNFAPLPIEIKDIEVFGDGPTALASYRGQELEKAVTPVEQLSSAESPSTTAGTRTIGEGHAAMVFFDLTLAPGARPPKELRHQFSFSVTRKNGEIIERTVDGAVVSVVQEPAPVLHAPLRGPGWIAFNALGAKDHRRSLNAVDGRERIPQRFAIDWMRIGPDGRLFHGDTKSNANFYDYGTEVLAVADGRVSDLKDGLPDNVGSTERSARNITLDNVFGNFLFLDLGQGRFALYAHLQPGSLRVKLGDAVKAGQVLALVGNSGNSDAPHLHFHLVDAASPMGSEGIPYELETFTQLGVVGDDPDVQDSGRILLPKSQEKPVIHEREFPVNNAAVTFP
ncbi:MAG TPA: M23 family metallopeptidase [Terriglobales bacterium]|nr:M23 family metallopeptidase [Terriglobales bacterium]